MLMLVTNVDEDVESKYVGSKASHPNVNRHLVTKIIAPVALPGVEIQDSLLRFSLNCSVKPRCFDTLYTVIFNVFITGVEPA